MKAFTHPTNKEAPTPEAVVDGSACIILAIKPGETFTGSDKLPFLLERPGLRPGRTLVITQKGTLITLDGDDAASLDSVKAFLQNRP
jgi:hypothetical protein